MYIHNAFEKRFIQENSVNIMKQKKNGDKQGIIIKQAIRIFYAPFFSFCISIRELDTYAEFKNYFSSTMCVLSQKRLEKKIISDYLVTFLR